jgi:acyl-CoA synthetase (AMP-forming)/AMP-acid ligase II
VSAIRATLPVPGERAERYRAARLWDDRLLRDGIEAAAARRPDAMAVADDHRSLTWAEASRLVSAGVGRLVERGERPVGRAALVTGNTVAGWIAYHSLLRAGATSILLDRRCGPSDLRHALDVLGSGATVIAPADERARLLDGLAKLEVLPLEPFGHAGRGEPPSVGWSEPDRDAPAVVLLTSGTTGRPKAAIHSVNTLTAGARNMACITGADSGSVAFLVSPLASITGVMQMHMVADQHGALVLEDRFDPEESLDRIDSHGATLLGGAPVIAERLLRSAERRADRRIALRTLALGGAMLPRPLLELATDAFGIEVARVYGSTEAPNSSGSLPSDGRDLRLADDGALMPGTEFRVGSKEHAQEGLIRGPAVFLGYVDPVDTQAAFEDDWYRTGDAVELEGSRLTVVGRLKEVVNRNGLKISLGEVEAALARLPDVVEVACFGLPDPETGERLAVAVRPEVGRETDLERVVEHLRSEGLAVRKLPEQLIVWEQPLPRTASGKIIRSRLAMESAGRSAQLAARLWRGVTG